MTNAITNPAEHLCRVAFVRIPTTGEDIIRFVDGGVEVRVRCAAPPCAAGYNDYATGLYALACHIGPDAAADAWL